MAHLKLVPNLPDTLSCDAADPDELRAAGRESARRAAENLAWAQAYIASQGK